MFRIKQLHYYPIPNLSLNVEIPKSKTAYVFIQTPKLISYRTLRLFSHLHNANMRDFVGDIARIKGESLVSQLAHSAWHMIQVQEV